MTHETLRLVIYKEDPREQVIWNQDRPIAYLNCGDATLDEFIELEDLIQAAPVMLEEVDALANIVALNSHGEDCWAEYWWDSGCDCGLMDLVLQLSPELQNKLEVVRKTKQN